MILLYIFETKKFFLILNILLIYDITNHKLGKS